MACLILFLLLGALLLAGGLGVVKLFRWASEQAERRAKLEARVAAAEQTLAGRADAQGPLDEDRLKRYLAVRRAIKGKARPYVPVPNGDLEACEQWAELVVEWLELLAANDLTREDWRRITEQLYELPSSLEPQERAVVEAHRAEIDALRDEDLDDLLRDGTSGGISSRAIVSADWDD